MKITKAQLSQVIKEELAVLMKEADIAPLQKELMDAVGVIANAYEGIELPPSVADLKAMIEAGNLLQASHDITDMWNELLMFHRDSGTKVPSYAVIKNFQAVNRLLKKVPDSIGGQVGQRTPQRPINRDKDGNLIPVFEESSAEVDKITKTQLAQIIKEEYQRTLNEDDDWDAGYDARDERGDPDNWDHSYDDNNSYEGGNLTDDEVSEFAEAYGAVEQLRRIKPTALPESVSDAILDMLNKLGIYL